MILETREISAEPQAQPRNQWLMHTIFVGAYALIAIYLYSGLLSRGNGYLTDSGQDQNQWEWFFAVTARAVSHGENPLLSTLQNHPLGVNMMANTAMFGLSIPLAPITLIFGPSVTWALVLTLGMAASAACWYWLMVRRLNISPLAAALGAAFAGFGPAMVSHGNAHPNLAVLFMIPLIIGQLLVLRTVKQGFVLGLLVAYQVFLGEEALLMCATGLAIFAVAYAILRPHQAWATARQMFPALGMAMLVFLPLVAFPLWWQFTGPQSYHSLLHGNAGNDLVALGSFPTRSVAGGPAASALSFGPTEENSFFGWPLIILFAAVSVLTWRVIAARALVLTTAVATLLSLGSWVVINGHTTTIPGPWLLVSRLPLYESILESRLTMICVPALGILLALTNDLIFARKVVTTSAAWSVALAAALIPLIPIPLATDAREPTPTFFSAGIWRQYVPANDPQPVLVPVPVPEPADAQALHWQVDAGLGFALPDGYFVGPWGPSGQGVYGAVPRATADLLRRVRDTGQIPILTDSDRANARTDFAYWGADAVVLAPGPRQTELRATLDQLLGPGRSAGGVWVWAAKVL